MAAIVAIFGQAAYGKPYCPELKAGWTPTTLLENGWAFGGWMKEYSPTPDDQYELRNAWLYNPGVGKPATCHYQVVGKGENVLRLINTDPSLTTANFNLQPSNVKPDGLHCTARTCELVPK